MVEPYVGTDGISGLETILYLGQHRRSWSRVNRESLIIEVRCVRNASGGRAHTKGIRERVVSTQQGESTQCWWACIATTVCCWSCWKNDWLSKERGQIPIVYFCLYDGLISEKTQFWLSSGIDVKFGANGLDVNFASIESILTGGVSCCREH